MWDGRTCHPALSSGEPFHTLKQEQSMATVAMTGIREISILDRAGAYGDALSRVASWASTATLVVIFLWFGCMKFVPFEAEGLKPIISNNALISWLYTLFGVTGGARFLGVFEIATGLLIAGRLVSPKLSALGGMMGAWSFLLTTSCLFDDPWRDPARLRRLAWAGGIIPGQEHRPVFDVPVDRRSVPGRDAEPCSGLNGRGCGMAHSLRASPACAPSLHGQRP